MRTGDTYEVDGVMDLSTEDADLQGNPFEDQITEAIDTAQLRIAITFPGEVLETNGQVDGTTVTWEPVFGERNVLTAVASASGDGASDTAGGTDAAGASGEDSGSSTSVYLLIGLVIVGVGVGLVLMMRRKRATTPTAAVSGEEASRGVSPPPGSLPQTSVATPPPASNPPPPPVGTYDGGSESSA